MHHYDEAKELCDFIAQNPSPFHVVSALSDLLKKAGFIEAESGKPFPRQEEGKGYFTTREGSSILAWRIPKAKGGRKAFSIVSAHTDSPTLRLKSGSLIPNKDGYLVLDMETYGGLLMAPWFDRPLSLAGRVFYTKADGTVACALVSFDRDLCMLPSLAIHMNRNANHGIDYNVQKELMPLIGQDDKDWEVNDLLAEELGIDKSSILESDLTLVNRSPASNWGLHKEFFSSPRIDDLECAYSAMKALLAAKEPNTIAVCALFDNEEVGSGTSRGALGDLLERTLERIADGLGWSLDERCQAQDGSFMLSADNGHAVHPNYPEVAEPVIRPKMNGGVLVKFAANQKYTSSALSASMFENLLAKKGIPFQRFYNNSNVPGGSTLGNLSNRHYSLPTVDIGAAQLAMHSPYETAGVDDAYFLVEAMHSFYERG